MLQASERTALVLADRRVINGVAKAAQVQSEAPGRTKVHSSRFYPQSSWQFLGLAFL